MCRFNQHRLLDLQFRRETLPPLFASCLELSPWPCRAPPPPSPGFTLQAAQSAHPLAWYHSGTVFGYWCRTCPSRPLAQLQRLWTEEQKKRKKKSVFSAPILGETWGEGAGWWLSNGLNICTCDAKCVAERDGICRTSALSCADEDPPLLPPNIQHPSPPSLPLILSLLSLLNTFV